MPLSDFSKNLLPGFIFTALLMLTMGASLDTDHHTTLNHKSNQASVKKEEVKVKPVHALFTSVKTFDELQYKLKQARHAKKPVMIEFYASWCPACRAIDREVFSRASVQRLMRPFTNIRVDLTTKNADLTQIALYYQVYGTPTFIFYDKNGNEFNTNRFRSVEEFKDVLSRLSH